MTDKTQNMKHEFNEHDVLKIQTFVENKLQSNINPAYIIHDISYLNKLIKKANKLFKKDPLNSSDQNLTHALIYFYFLGYSSDKNNPLQKSVSEAQAYLVGNGYTEDQIKLVTQGLASLNSFDRIHSKPHAIAHDVLYTKFSSKKILEFMSKGLEEQNIASDQKTDEVKWISQTLDDMIEHKYNTKVAKKKWKQRKRDNIKLLRRHLNKIKRKSSLTSNKQAMTMFKTSSRNQIDLINIADKKAGIMITVNAVLITILLPLFASYIIDMSYFIIPSVILIITCGLSIVLATLATKPSTTDTPSHQDYISGNKSLFYFRNFINLNKEEYRENIQELIVRDAQFENAVVNGLYDQGITLGIKYRKLTWCYWIFAIGMALTILSLLVSLYFFKDF